MYTLHKTSGAASPPHAQDHWIESYLETLERWRIERRAGEIVRRYLCKAWAAYGLFRISGDPHDRWLAWQAIQSAASSLQKLKEHARVV